MAAMSMKKNEAYPDATPAVHIALAKATAQCAATAATMAEAMGGDEEQMTSLCVRNAAMISPILNSSYYVRKEVMGWDCRI